MLGEMRLPRRVVNLGFVIVFGCFASACSITMPLTGFAGADDEPAAARTTGSITAAPVTAAAPLPLKPDELKAHIAAHGQQGRELSARISRPRPGFPGDLGPEELRRAHGALALALDPQGNGKDVGWSNPQSGIKGVIIPAGGPYLKADEICRGFTATTTLQSGPIRQKGVACRPSGGEWSIRDMAKL